MVIYLVALKDDLWVEAMAALWHVLKVLRLADLKEHSSLAWLVET